MPHTRVLDKHVSLSSSVLLFVLLTFPTAVLAQASAIVAGEVQIEEALIPMKDGIKLAADLYLPVNMKNNERLPVILEYLPYRKDESRPSRLGTFHYFVEQGIIVVRVDIRGTGRSEGQLVDGEY